MGHDGARLIAALRALLDAESVAIRQGDFAQFGALGARKAALVAALPGLGDGAPLRDLKRLRTAAEANGRLLAAAIRGVAAARARLASIRQVGTRLDTYDSAGRARSVRFGEGSVERRA
jgi:hypothetical protein